MIKTKEEEIGELISQIIEKAEANNIDLPVGIPAEDILKLMDLTEGNDEHAFLSSLFGGVIIRGFVDVFDTLTIEFHKFKGKDLPESIRPAWKYDEEEKWWIKPPQ